MNDFDRSAKDAGHCSSEAHGSAPLSDEQWFRQVAGEAEPGCVSPRALAMRETLANFRAAVTELAGAAPALPQRRSLAIPARRSGSVWQVAAGLSFASVATVLAATMAFSSHRQPADAPATTDRAAIDRGTTGRAAISDAALLEGIDQDLATSVPPSLAPLAITASANTTTSSN